MSTRLKSFLVNLSIEPERFSAFVADPKAAAERAGLSEAEQAILFSGDQNQIYTAVAASSEAVSADPDRASSRPPGD